jgi:hypothetical protein
MEASVGSWSRPISRRVLSELTGLSVRTLQYYQRDLGPKVLESRQNAALTTLQWEPGDRVPDGHFVDIVGEKVKVLRRLPNSYRSHLRTAPRGMSRRVNRQLSAGKSVRISGTGDRRRQRLYYERVKAAVRRMHEREEGDHFYLMGAELDSQPVKASRCGARLWSQFRIADGRVYCG